jgi:hypothetical protein
MAHYTLYTIPAGVEGPAKSKPTDPRAFAICATYYLNTKTKNVFFFSAFLEFLGAQKHHAHIFTKSPC